MNFKISILPAVKKVHLLRNVCVGGTQFKQKMKRSKTQTEKLNIITSLLSRLVSTACGIVVPWAMIKNFGSATYGVTSSIAQFLSYIALLEGGVGRVGRAELYAPLANKDEYEVSRVYHAIKRFFGIVAVTFVFYTLVLSLEYYDMARIDVLDRRTVFWLIWIISASTLAKYFSGLTNLTLLQADQKQYISFTIVMIATIANAVMIVVLANSGCSVVLVKTASSITYVMQPVCYAIYVKKHYRLVNVGKNHSKLEQKWTGMGQHIAYFLHQNTDVVLLTLFADIRLVAVYNVYKLVVSNLARIAVSFTGGMEAVFGELFVKNEKEQLQKTFWKYKYMLTFVTIVMFGTAAVMIIPFVRLYTKGVTDVNYIRPVFAMVILIAEALECAVHPCSSLPISANKLKETRWGSYGESLVNIGLSMILIWWNPLLGIAIGTLCAALVKNIYYIWYAARKILGIRFRELLKIFLFTVFVLSFCSAVGIFAANSELIANYFLWVLFGILSVILISAGTAAISALLYPDELKWMLKFVKSKYAK